MRQVIIDTDMGVDDAHALVMALLSPEIEILGITTVFGNSKVENCTRNVLYLLDLVEQSHIPVFQGAHQPILRRERGEDKDYNFGSLVHGDNGIGNFPLPQDFDAKPRDENAILWIIEQVNRAPGQIDLLILGPQSNLAALTLAEPRLASRVRSVVFMGGVIDGPGNLGPLSTANIRNDAEAAYIRCTVPG